MQTYRVVIERDEDVWLARVPSVRGCHTWGRSIDQTLTRTLEALSLFVGPVGSAALEPDLRIPDAWRADAERARRLRRRAIEAHEAAADALRSAIWQLDAAGLSRRDIAHLLGVSHQRVQQLLQDR